MNFIIEVLKKKENEHILVFVVRNSQGFPQLVADSLDEAKEFIQNQTSSAKQHRSDFE